MEVAADPNSLNCAVGEVEVPGESLNSAARIGSNEAACR